MLACFGVLLNHHKNSNRLCTEIKSAHPLLQSLQPAFEPYNQENEKFVVLSTTTAFVQFRVFFGVDSLLCFFLVFDSD